MGVVVPEATFKLGGVRAAVLQRLAASGHASTRWSCPECGSRIAGPARDGVVRVRPEYSMIRRGSDQPRISGSEQAALGSFRRRRRVVEKGPRASDKEVSASV